METKARLESTMWLVEKHEKEIGIKTVLDETGSIQGELACAAPIFTQTELKIM